MKVIPTILCALLSTVALATTYQLPTMVELTTRSCGNGPEPYVVTGTTPEGYATGKVFGYTSCSAGGRGAGNTYYAGCAEATWDGNGVLMSYSLLWQSVGRAVPKAAQCLP